MDSVWEKNYNREYKRNCELREAIRKLCGDLGPDPTHKDTMESLWKKINDEKI